MAESDLPAESRTLDSVECLLCGAATPRAFAKNGSPTYFCRACGFTETRHLTNHNFAPIEDAAYIDYFNADDAEEPNFRSVFAWLSGFCGEGSILDIGAGSGQWVEFLRRNGVISNGLEASEFVYENWIANSPRASWIKNVRLEEYAPGESFDRVTAIDVLEHLPDPNLAIEQLARLTKPGGYAFLSTPNVESIPARIFGRRWHYYNDYHYSLFSARALVKLLEAHGFSVLSVTHRGRLVSLRHLWMYGWNFGLGIDPPWFPGFVQTTIRVNTFDTMYLAARRNSHPD